LDESVPADIDPMGEEARKLYRVSAFCLCAHCFPSRGVIRIGT
jgi:hypothetical protein